MPIATLTTDWGTSDYYVAALKGRILSACPEICIVDISHEPSYLESIAQGAYQLRHAYPFFPKGSIHVVGVCSEAYPEEPFIAAEANGQLFICKNNGFLSLVLDDFVSATAIAPPAERAASFGMLHAVPPAVQQLLHGAPVGSLGEAITPKAFTQPQPIVRFDPTEIAAGQGVKPRVDAIVGHILHIDSHGNVITNITRELFYGSAHDRPYTILINSTRYSLSQVGSTYDSVSGGMPVAFFNAQDLLEIAVNQGNASHLYRLDSAGSITIKFQN
ncbi:MAG: SAM-dependent chlorinase/fluorinase [Prevotellaceae bacterium]|jgi:S-adenosylmethionine hydrolase|nr:SAM-dependent chlorinase/fluorinase [Prevotellaceae bacterium]